MLIIENINSDVPPRHTLMLTYEGRRAMTAIRQHAGTKRIRLSREISGDVTAPDFVSIMPQTLSRYSSSK